MILLVTKQVIVSAPHLLELMSVCREPNCGGLVAKENIDVVVNGAMIRVRTLCNNNHEKVWDSSPMLGIGSEAISFINVQLASYCLLTGLHVKQVMITIMKMSSALFVS